MDKNLPSVFSKSIAVPALVLLLTTNAMAEPFWNKWFGTEPMPEVEELDEMPEWDWEKFEHELNMSSYYPDISDQFESLPNAELEELARELGLTQISAHIKACESLNHTSVNQTKDLLRAFNKEIGYGFEIIENGRYHLVTPQNPPAFINQEASKKYLGRYMDLAGELASLTINHKDCSFKVAEDANRLLLKAITTYDFYLQKGWHAPSENLEKPFLRI